MKYSIKHLLSVSLLFSAYAFGLQTMDSMRSQLAPGPDMDFLGTPVVSTGDSGYTEPLEGIPASAKTPAAREAAANANLRGATRFNASVPSELQKFLTPALIQNKEFANFLTKQQEFWAKKKALIAQYPELKAKMKEHVQLKQEMLKFKEKSPEYKTFFKEQMKYWINKADTGLLGASEGQLTAKSGLEAIPAELQKYVTPAMKNNPEFISFLTKQHQFWTAKKALIAKYPALKEFAKQHIELKKEMLKFKESNPAAEKFFEESFKYRLNQAAAELK